LKDWRAEMGPKIEAAQEMLASSIGADNIRAWGRRSPHGSLEQIPSGDFRMSGIQLIVGTHGELASVPRRRISAYDGIQWCDIEFDQAEIKKTWPKPPPPSANDWMLKAAQQFFNQHGQPAKRGDLVDRCTKEARCTKRDAEGAFKKLPMNLRRARGKPPKHSG
jgi:hypothetical protein